MLKETHAHIESQRFDAYKARIKKLKSKLDTTQIGVNNTLAETQPQKYHELAKNTITLDSKSQGAPPNNAGIEIIKNEGTVFSLDKPQCTVDREGNWFYNFEGARTLARVLGRKLPSITELVASIGADPENFKDNAGYRDASLGEFYDRGSVSYFWSADENGTFSARFAFLGRSGSQASAGVSRRSLGMSVRFVVDNA